MSSFQTRCRHFSGYKPCSKSTTCNESCLHLDIPKDQILIVHLEALGAVLRSTALLPAIKKKYPSSMITWVTRKPAHILLENNSFIDRIFTTDSDDLLKLSALQFDYGFVIDKDLSAAGVIKHTKVKNIFGFLNDPVNGAIIPANKSAFEVWELGLDNSKKFFENKKPETQLICEALELPYERSDYQIQFSADEQSEIKVRRKLWLNGQKKIVVGINTGCSPKMQARRLSVQGHKKLILALQKKYGSKIQMVLLGGPDERFTNEALVSKNVLPSPTQEGLRDGLISVAACDVVISGDSLGMHMAIALKKWVVVWFGPTCYQEIDLFGRGVKVLTGAACSPCWLRDCQKQKMCYDQVSYDDIVFGVEKGIQWIKTSSSYKRPFSETLPLQSL